MRAPQRRSAEANSGAVFRNGPVQVAFPRARDQVVVSDCFVWLEAYGDAVLRDGPVHVAFIIERKAEVVVSSCEVRLEAKGGAPLSDSPLRVAFVQERGPRLSEALRCPAEGE